MASVVIVDGKRFVPEPPSKEHASKVLEALEWRINSNAGDGITIREYLHKLLTKAYKEGESFNGKRPFGNSGWHRELWRGFVKGGFIAAKHDESEDAEEDREYEEKDSGEADAFGYAVINAAFFASIK
jgi:hypothetical protein